MMATCERGQLLTASGLHKVTLAGYQRVSTSACDSEKDQNFPSKDRDSRLAVMPCETRIDFSHLESTVESPGKQD
jgi:hypothetical protein